MPGQQAPCAGLVPVAHIRFDIFSRSYLQLWLDKPAFSFAWQAETATWWTASTPSPNETVYWFITAPFSTPIIELQTVYWFITAPFSTTIIEMLFRFVAPVSVLYQKIMTSSVQPSQPVLSFTLRQNQRGSHRLTVRMTSPTVPVKPSVHLPNTSRGRCVSYPACTSSLTAGDPFPPQFPFNHALYEAHDLRDKLPTRRITYRHRVAMHGWVHCSTSPSQVHHFPLALLSTTMPLIIPRLGLSYSFTATPRISPPQIQHNVSRDTIRGSCIPPFFRTFGVFGIVLRA